MTYPNDIFLCCSSLFLIESAMVRASCQVLCQVSEWGSPRNIPYFLPQVAYRDLYTEIFYLNNCIFTILFIFLTSGYAPRGLWGNFEMGGVEFSNPFFIQILKEKGTCEKLTCKGEPYQFSGQRDPGSNNQTDIQTDKLFLYNEDILNIISTCYPREVRPAWKVEDRPSAGCRTPISCHMPHSEGSLGQSGQF